MANLDSNVITFGCRLNIYESEIIRQNLKIARSNDNKFRNNDIVVFNTCAVTKEAEKQARQAIRKLRKTDPTKKIIVTGCAAQNNPDMFDKMPEVDKVIGNQEKLIHTNYNLDETKVSVGDIMSATSEDLKTESITSFEGRARAIIQVQNGCNHRCTFCMIPYGRGNSRSVPIGFIGKQIKQLVANGYNEVVLTGVDVTAYGADLPGSPTFAQMIRRVLALVPELPRLRLSSIDVAEIDVELFDLMANHDRLMPHFHISLQAGDNMILKRMKRRHNRKQVIDFCHKLRKIRPEVSFGADIIAGFPTETDEMFDNTRKLITEADIQYLHVFPYSEREGTPASKMPQVAKVIRKQRSEELRKIGEKQVHNFYQQNIGKNVQLLVEHNNIAHTENFISVELQDGHKFSPGQIINSKLVSIKNNHMVVS